jgi:hypothetical protein
MAYTIRAVEYFYVNVHDEVGAAYRVLSQLAERGVNLLAFTAIPTARLWRSPRSFRRIRTSWSSRRDPPACHSTAPTMRCSCRATTSSVPSLASTNASSGQA